MLIPLFCSKELSKNCFKKTKETIGDGWMYSSCVRDLKRCISWILKTDRRRSYRTSEPRKAAVCYIIGGRALTICRIGVFSGSYIRWRGKKKPSEFWEALIQKLKLWPYNAKARITGEDPGIWINQKLLKNNNRTMESSVSKEGRCHLGWHGQVLTRAQKVGSLVDNPGKGMSPEVMKFQKQLNDLTTTKKWSVVFIAEVYGII